MDFVSTSVARDPAGLSQALGQAQSSALDDVDLDWLDAHPSAFQPSDSFFHVVGQAVQFKATNQSRRDTRLADVGDDREFCDNSQTTGLVMSRCGNISHSRAVFRGLAARLALQSA